MEQFRFDLAVTREAQGTRAMALVGVVASGNLEVLVQRGAAPGRCVIEVNTAAMGFRELWEAVVADFAARRAAGGLLIAINDGGARPDTVSLRLAQGVRQIEESQS
jgi:malonate decarboxylase delta subunit